MKESAAAKRKSRVSPAGAAGKNGSYRQQVYQLLVRKITNGELPAGVPLYEVPLAREFGVSRTPVREAIGQLVSEGVLHEIGGRGTIVVEPTRQDIVELYQLREALETYAVGMLASRGLVSQDLEAIEKNLAETLAIRAELEQTGKPALEGDLLQRFVTSDMRFHMHLLHAAGNRRFIKVISNTRLLIRIFTFRREHHTAELLNHVHAYHRQILDAVVKKDVETATRVMREHIRLSLEERLAEYQLEWADRLPELGQI
jgi:DNA-binding GntR family transcriptional regulator